MKPVFKYSSAHLLTLAFTFAGTTVLPAQTQIVTPSRGGGLDTNSPMVHADIMLDVGTGRLTAAVDTNYARPKLVPLPEGYAFDTASKYRVLSGKSYNFQYAWNPGGAFTPPPGGAIWIECLTATPGLETYDGPGNKMESPPRPYTPIFGTDGSARLWQWYGRMAHNTYAIRNPVTNVVSATYRIFIGDTETGSPEAFNQYQATTVTLAWDIAEPAYVTPFLAGGQATGEMIHIDVTYDPDTKQLAAHVDDSLGIPELLPLGPSQAFELEPRYGLLNGRSYNSQYGWNPGGFLALPAGAAIWIEQTRATPGLEVYEGNGKGGSYLPIFGTAEGAWKWKWSGAMVHNTYAVANPCRDTYTAEYRVYLGDAQTGDPVPYANVAPSTARLTWRTAPAAFPPELKLWSLAAGPAGLTATFTGERWAAFYLERSTSLGPRAAWSTVAGPLTSSNRVQQALDSAPTAGAGFYRLRAEE